MPKVVVPVTLNLSADQIELLDRHGELVADLFGKVISISIICKPKPKFVGTRVRSSLKPPDRSISDCDQVYRVV